MTTQADLEKWGYPGNGLSTYFNPAKNTLQDMVKLFSQGGGYGAGQNAIIDTAASQAQAKAASDAVASGMSSGSLAASTGQRISSDTAKAKLGVEDTRTNFLAQAMQALSALYGQFGGMDSNERMNQANLKARGTTTGGSTVSFGSGGDPTNSFFNSRPTQWGVPPTSENYWSINGDGAGTGGYANPQG